MVELHIFLFFNEMQISYKLGKKTGNAVFCYFVLPRNDFFASTV